MKALSFSPPHSELRQALAQSKSSFLTAGYFSLCINLLLLLPAIYMLQVYDRVLPASSEPTLVMLTLLALFLFLVLGGLEWLRSQILIVTSTRLDHALGGRIFDAMFTQAQASGGQNASAQPLADLLTLRQFLTGQGLFAFFDAPWLPAYIAVMYLFHPWYGRVAVLASVVLLGLALINELITRRQLAQANVEAIEASNFTQGSLRQAEAIEAMGMRARLRERWQEREERLLAWQGQASARGSLISALSKTLRLTVQTLILGLGAYLAIHKEVTPGMVVAGSILLGRALAPLDLLIASWRSFLNARQAYGRLSELLAATPATDTPMDLPAPRGELWLDRLVVMPPGVAEPILKGISLVVEPGQQVAVVGPSAAGKTTLLRALLGLVPARAGTVRLDGAEINQWDREALGHHVGYLPQDVELLDGSVADNIARFGAVDAAKVVAAAQAAGIHEMILRLPEGYATRLAGKMTSLSAGQQQRLGLARALYDDPQLIVLDEPDANLDQDGEAALARTLATLKLQGRTVVVVSHRPALLSQVDRILLMSDGRLLRYGPRDQILAQLQGDSPWSQRPATPVTVATAGLPAQ